MPFNFSREKQVIGPDKNYGLPIIEPSPREIFGQLLKNFISVFFIEIILEAKLSEFSARTVTAENAVVKSNELTRKITLDMLKAHRMSVTQKQLESSIVHQVK